MNTKKLNILVVVCFALLPVVLWSNNLEDGKLLDYMKGDGTFESWFMEAFAKLDTFVEDRARAASELGKVIGGLGMLIYMSVLGWKMQSGDAEWSVEPMIKPIIIGLILINWVGFTRVIQYPFQKLSEPSEAHFKELEEASNNLRLIRYTKQIQVLNAAIKLKADADAQKESFGALVLKGEVLQAVGDQMDKLMSPIAEFTERLNYVWQKTASEFWEMITLTILRVAVYFIFFIQKIWAYILIVLGPIAIGISLIPGFESSLYSWISKFININLYGFVAYTIINIGQQLIMSGFAMEIDRLSQIVNDKGELINEALLINYTTHNGMISTIIFPTVGYLVTAVGVLMTPTIADAIVSAGGAGVMTKGKQATGKVASAAGRVASAAGKATKVLAGDATASAKLAKQAMNTMTTK
ncbi:MAG: hypothetical protein Q4G08_09735 [Capnocytophaga sp.]|nr:hypothetical protein [Capnocytophaga sp.]